MAVKNRQKRMGKIPAPFYRVVVMDSRTKRDGRAIEEIGKYHPTQEPSLIEIDMERADYWIGNGAQPTEAVAALITLVREGNVKTKEQGPTKKERYEAAVAAAGKASGSASTPRKAEKRTETVEPPAATEAEAAPPESPGTES
ncbi:MAG: 30S ribosomal protein S16 [Intrasporangium sp.]|uniref:30S ribosomal protein S16 n=1 Tax=Intrasporangium sp. TaxID=1925024 RepID=UPI0026493E84|nr:30S ribosomal protein S16 [Intrasporangium sp.]MDN5797441.1 30S ribosomal protein S16 [Intrasporangium sp.]